MGCKIGGCGDPISNAFHKLCVRHNQDRLKANKKPKGDVTIVNVKQPIKITKMRPKVAKIKVAAVTIKHEDVNPYNVSGQKELFGIIWKERPHVCVQCNTKLGDEAKAHFFSHIYPKSIRPWLKLDPDNIELLCMECHHEHDFGKRVNKLK